MANDDQKGEKPSRKPKQAGKADEAHENAEAQDEALGGSGEAQGTGAADHLKPYRFKPGVSGNPSGRPKGHRSMRERLKRVLRGKVRGYQFAVAACKEIGLTEEQIDTMDVGDCLALSAFVQAFDGKGQYFVELMTRLEGRVMGPINEDNCEVAEPTSPDEHRAAAISLYRSIITDPASNPKDRLVAQSEINRLTGLIENEASPQEHARNIQQALDEMLGATMPEQEDDKAGE